MRLTRRRLLAALGGFWLLYVLHAAVQSVLLRLQRGKLANQITSKDCGGAQPYPERLVGVWAPQGAHVPAQLAPWWGEAALRPVVMDAEAPMRVVYRDEAHILLVQHPLTAVLAQFARRGPGGMAALDACASRPDVEWFDCGILREPLLDNFKGWGTRTRFALVGDVDRPRELARALHMRLPMHFPEALPEVAGAGAGAGAPSAATLARLRSVMAAEIAFFDDVLSPQAAQLAEACAAADEVEALMRREFSLATDVRAVSARAAGSPPKVVGVLATALTGRYQDVFDEMWGQLGYTGLLQRTDELVVSVLGAADEGEVAIPQRAAHPNVAVMRNARKDLWEFPALEKLHSMCVADPSALAYYIHTKGVRNGEGQPESGRGGYRRDAWRRYMMHNVADHWQDNVALLAGGGAATTSGVLWRSWEHSPGNQRYSPHYAGNFWWAACRHVAALPSPVKFATHHYGSLDEAFEFDARCWAEAWLASGGVEGMAECLKPDPPIDIDAFFPRSAWEGSEWLCGP